MNFFDFDKLVCCNSRNQSSISQKEALKQKEQICINTQISSEKALKIFFSQKRKETLSNFQQTSDPISQQDDGYLDEFFVHNNNNQKIGVERAFESQNQHLESILNKDQEPLEERNYKNIINVKRIHKKWTAEEDMQLIKYHKQYCGNWIIIALNIPGRNISQSIARWRRINPQLYNVNVFYLIIYEAQNKQKWSQEDDQKVLEFVQIHGKNWCLISKEMSNHKGKQIRQRYLNKLDPCLRLEKWTREEDEKIYELCLIWGSKWSFIASQLQGRSENMVKNRFYTYIKRVMLGLKIIPMKILKLWMNKNQQIFTLYQQFLFQKQHQLSYKINNLELEIEDQKLEEEEQEEEFFQSQIFNNYIDYNQ